MRIQIIGASGCGKSTLGKALGESLGVPLLECDRYYWADADFRCMRSDEEKRSMLLSDLATHADFVLTGAPQSFAQGYPGNLDLLVFLRLDEDVRTERLRAREMLRYGSRAMPGGDHYEDTESFLAWAATYTTSDDTIGNSLMSHRKLLAEASCRWIELDATLSVAKLVDVVLACL